MSPFYVLGTVLSICKWIILLIPETNPVTLMVLNAGVFRCQL